MHAVEFNVVSTHPKETTLNERRLIRTATPKLVGVLHRCQKAFFGPYEQRIVTGERPFAATQLQSHHAICNPNSDSQSVDSYLK